MKSLEQKLAAVTAEHELEAAIRGQLPEEPRQVFTGSRLYGCSATVKYGDSFQAYGDKPAYRLRTLREALELLGSLGEIVPLFEVRGGCIGLQPEDSITEKQRERATLTGPYGCKITSEHSGGARLQAFVTLAEGQRIDVSIQLNPHERGYGSWHRCEGHPQYDQTWKFRADEARDLGHEKLIRFYAGEPGPRHGHKLVYLFTFASDLEDVVAKAEAAEVLGCPDGREIQGGDV